jgi:hypothetical protein
MRDVWRCSWQKRAILVFITTISMTAMPSKRVFSEGRFDICFGEYESVCRTHSYTLFLNCMDRETPQQVASRLCHTPEFRIQGLFSEGGNMCGYAWYSILCE